MIKIKEAPVFPSRRNPSIESMNNFHGNMPGGFYRGEREEGTIGHAAFQTYVHLLEQDKSTWSEDERDFLRKYRIKLAIHKDIDEILAANPKLLGDWQTVQPISEGGLSPAMREHVLRPVYVELRKKYTEEELSG